MQADAAVKESTRPVSPLAFALVLLLLLLLLLIVGGLAVAVVAWDRRRNA
ncbi:MAG: hypothetical protein M3094_10355 [Actinomycetia bacterium]|nr:hypothetical protein [Actinomycetes bacterium]